MKALAPATDDLLLGVQALIDSAHKRVAVAVNAELTLLYWQPGEAPPLGIILCAGKKREQIELLELPVAEYLTVLPPREALEARLHRANTDAQERLTTTEAT